MSLAIEIDDVTHVLLADGWHEVPDDSFFVDSYEYMSGKRLDFPGGSSDVVCATGFAFKGPDGDMIFGPLTSIIAVRTRLRKKS